MGGPVDYNELNYVQKDLYRKHMSLSDSQSLKHIIKHNNEADYSLMES